jgi:hypothetical protein
MAKVKLIKYLPGFFCPACASIHCVDTRWKYNYRDDKPTFTPEIRVRVAGFPPGHPHEGQTIDCHSVIKNGDITFLSSSSHAMKGQKTELPDIDAVLKKARTQVDIQNQMTARIEDEIVRVHQRISELDPEFDTYGLGDSVNKKEPPGSDGYRRSLLKISLEALWRVSEGTEGLNPRPQEPKGFDAETQHNDEKGEQQ